MSDDKLLRAAKRLRISALVQLWSIEDGARGVHMADIANAFWREPLHLDADRSTILARYSAVKCRNPHWFAPIYMAAAEQKTTKYRRRQGVSRPSQAL